MTDAYFFCLNSGTRPPKTAANVHAAVPSTINFSLSDKCNIARAIQSSFTSNYNNNSNGSLKTTQILILFPYYLFIQSVYIIILAFIFHSDPGGWSHRWKINMSIIATKNSPCPSLSYSLSLYRNSFKSVQWFICAR